MRKTIPLYLLLVFISLSNKLVAQSWSELGGLNGFAPNGLIVSICSDATGNVYVAGSFRNDSGKSYVAKYNGTTWSELGGLNSLSANGPIISVYADVTGNIYAGGVFTDGPGAYIGNYYVAKYNGTVWNELPFLNGWGVVGPISSICEDSNGNVYAVGEYGVGKYDGTRFNLIEGFNRGGFNSICRDGAGNIYTGGDFIDNNNHLFVGKYNGIGWSELGGGINDTSVHSFISSICIDVESTIYATGYFTNDSGKYYVAKYNGISWSELGGLNSLAANRWITSICADAAGNIYAAGLFTNENGKHYVAKYNGVSWSELGGLNGLAADSTISSVCSDAAGNIYAAGFFTNTSGNRYVARYGSVTGVKPLSISQAMNVVPSPCSDCRVVISSPSASSLQVMDLLGNSLPAQFEKTEDGYLINMPNQNAGVYIIHDIKTGRALKFVKL